MSVADFPEADFRPVEGFKIQVKTVFSKRITSGSPVLTSDSEENAKLSLQPRVRQ